MLVCASRLSPVSVEGATPCVLAGFASGPTSATSIAVAASTNANRAPKSGRVGIAPTKIALNPLEEEVVL